jgi:hypothetical protein
MKANPGELGGNLGSFSTHAGSGSSTQNAQGAQT